MWSVKRCSRMGKGRGKLRERREGSERREVGMQVKIAQSATYSGSLYLSLRPKSEIKNRSETYLMQKQK